MRTPTQARRPMPTGGRWLRTALAGSLLFGGVITASVLVGSLSAQAATVVQTITVGSAPEGVSSDGTDVWVANAGGNTVTELNASTGAFVGTIAVGSEPIGVSSDGTDVWVANYGGNSVTELNASTGAVVGTITVGSEPYGVSSDGTHVWVANSGGNSVTELNASTGAVVGTITVGSQPIGVSSDGTHVWVTNAGGNTVTELNASTGAVVGTIAVGSEPFGVSSDGTHVWVANAGGNTVTELDASTGAVVNTIGVGSGPRGVSSDGTDVWVANLNDNTVTELNASTGAVVGTITVGSEPLGVSSDGTHVWVTNVGNKSVTEIAVKSPDVVGFTSTNPTPVVVGGTSYTPTASGGGSTSPVIISLDASSTGCSVNGGGTVTFTSVGTCVIDANQAGDANYTAASEVQQSITVGQGAQTVAFTSTNPSPVVVGGPSYTPTASGGESTSPVIISLDASSTGCSVNGSGVVTFTSVGTCVIDVNQAGDANYTAASEVKQSITVGQDTPSMPTISNLPSSANYGGGFTATVSTTGDGVTSVTSSTPSVCTASGLVVSYGGVGTCTLTAHVAQGTNYTAADGSAQSFTVFGFTITTSSLPSATPGVAYGPVTLQTAGAGTSTSPYVTTLQWKKVSLPKGLKLSKKTGVLSGTPSKKLTGGPSSVKVQVTETVTTRNGKKKVKTKTTVQATIPLTIT
jgi:YVTN family beta-propeller protein